MNVTKRPTFERPEAAVVLTRLLAPIAVAATKRLANRIR